MKRNFLSVLFSSISPHAKAKATASACICSSGYMANSGCYRCSTRRCSMSWSEDVTLSCTKNRRSELSHVSSSAEAARAAQRYPAAVCRTYVCSLTSLFPPATKDMGGTRTQVRQQSVQDRLSYILQYIKVSEA